MSKQLEEELAVGIENPYWDIVKDMPNDGLLSWDGAWRPSGRPDYRLPDAEYNAQIEAGLTRDALVGKYAWAIPSPESIGWLVAKLKGLGRTQVVEIGAGTGYWAWLLTQSGLDVNCYDKYPPAQGWNGFHSPTVRKYKEYSQEERDSYRKRWEDFDAMATEIEEWGKETGREITPLKRVPFKDLPIGEERMVLDGVPGEEHFVIHEGEHDALHLPENKGRVLFLCWPPFQTDMGLDVLTSYELAGGDTLVYIGEHGGCNATDEFFERLEKNWTHVESGPLVQWSGLHDHLDLYVRKTDETSTPG